MKISTKNICMFGVAIALWVVISSFLHIPIGINNLWIDAGYIVYGMMLALFGIPAAIIGVFGVLLENLLFTGWISYSWMAGQLVIGLVCGFIFKKFKNQWLAIAAIILSTWIGIGLVKTIIEVALGYGVFPMKIVSNSIASVLDMVPLVIGYYVAKIPAIKKFC